MKSSTDSSVSALKRSDSDPKQIDSFVNNKRIKAIMEFSESNGEVKLPPTVEEEFAEADLPNCWNTESAKHFRQKYPWMTLKEGKLGCIVCAEIKDNKPSHSENWIQCQVTANGNTKLTQQSSLRKKLFEHSKTARHMQMCRIIDGECRSATPLENAPPSNGTDEADDSYSYLEGKDFSDLSLSEEILVTARVFYVVYNLCQQNRPMVDIEGQIQMLKAMKVNVGHCLHSRFTAIRIVDHVGQQMKRQLMQKVIAQETKITVIVEEAVMKILQKPTFILLFHCNLPSNPNNNNNNNEPFLLFLDLFELHSATTDELHAEIFQRLALNGFDSNYLWRNMLNPPFYCLSTRTREKYPQLLRVLNGSDHPFSPNQIQSMHEAPFNLNTAECERMLNLLTQILTEERNRLNTEHISNLMAIKSIGKPITEWNPIPYVRTWVRNHRNAMDTRIKNHVEKAPTEYSRLLWAMVD